MDALLQALRKPEVVTALVIGIVGTWLATFFPRVGKAIARWGPETLTRSLKDAWAHVRVIGRAKETPLAAVAYVGFQLAQAIMASFAALVALWTILFVQLLDPQCCVWWHLLAIFSACAVLIMSVFRLAKRWFILRGFYEVVLNPPVSKNIPLLKGKDGQPIVEMISHDGEPLPPQDS